MIPMTQLLVSAMIAAGILGSTLTANAQAAQQQQTVLTWDAYVEPPIIPPATTVPLSLQFAGYQVNWGSGTLTCGAIGSQLGAMLAVIPRVVPPGVSPTSYTHTNYLDSPNLNCYEVFVKFGDGTFSPRSKRLFKEIISTKPPVSNPLVQ